MSKSTSSSKKIGSAVAAVVLAVLLAAVCVISCIAAGSGTNPADAASAFAKQQVTGFSDNSIRTNAVYASDVLRNAVIAAAMYTGKTEELEAIAQTLSADTVIITDEKAKIVTCYPEGAVTEKALKEIEVANKLVPVAKGIAVKAMSDVTTAEDGSYHVYTGAARNDAGGAVILYMATETYGDVSGANLAANCGTNVIVEKDGKRLSSSFTAAKDSTIDGLGVKEDGKATAITVDGKSYQAKAETADNYRVLTAVEAGGSNATMIIIIASAVAIVLGCIAMFVLGKKKDA